MRGGLGPAATTRLPMPEQILDDVEGTFDLGPRTCLDDFALLDRASQLGVAQ